MAGGPTSIPVWTTLAKVKTILGADYTLAMLCSIMNAPCCQTLICSNKANLVITGKHYMPSAEGSLYKSTSHNINGLNINSPQINCSIHQQKLVDV
jgi:hypothetical protein